MTWFRVGGGSGVPASLKSRMNAVLNKKFGTAVDYPPNGWPDDVNLLGPLPEATVSGSIVTFSDGADDVPTKSCEVALSPSLDGYAEVDVVQNGKNLVNIPDSAEITRNQLNSTIVPLLDDFLNGKKGNFTISAKTAETVENANFITIRINYTDSTSSSNVYIYRGSTHESGEITGTFSISSDPTKTIDSVSFGGNTGTAKCAVSEWQIEANSQATTYEPFTAPTTHTANLGRTIYGGTADIVNGTGIAGWALHKVTSSDGIYDYATGSGFRVSTSTWAEGIMKAESNNGGICNEFDTVTNNTNRGVRFSIGDNTSIYFVQVYSEIGNTVEAFKTWLDNHDVYVVYPIATPTDFTFTGQEINTRLGDNTMWSEQGETKVTYRRDIDLALQALSGSRGLMMASPPAIDPANGDQGSEESTENNIETEGEQDAR